MLAVMDAFFVVALVVAMLALAALAATAAVAVVAPRRQVGSANPASDSASARRG